MKIKVNEKEVKVTDIKSVKEWIDPIGVGKPTHKISQLTLSIHQEDTDFFVNLQSELYFTIQITSKVFQCGGAYLEGNIFTANCSD
jgi:hypothetical protein